MMIHVVRLTRWELFKVRKRWMPWILLAIAVALTQLGLWANYSQYQDLGRDGGTFWMEVTEDNVVRITCADVVEGNVDAKLALIPEQDHQEILEAVEERRTSVECEEMLEDEAEFRSFYRGGFVLPSSLANSLGVANSFGILLIMILTASAMGVEYGWGTLRTAMTRGVGRWQFLSAKALSLLLMGGAGLIIVGLGVVVSSLIFASLISGDGVGLADSGKWSTVAVMFAKAVYGLLPYVMLALFVSVLTSSSSMGIAISMAYFFIELILIQVLGGLFDWFSNVTDFLVGPSIGGWMAQTGVQSNSWIAEARVFTESVALVRITELPGQLHAFLVLTAYIAVLGGASLWLIRRRDIAGAKGE